MKIRPVLASILFAVTTSAVAAGGRPNIIYILADDLGYGDLECYNPRSKIRTPNLDRLAKEGVRFTDAHAPTAICSPTRYALLTGRYAWRSQLQRGVVGQWGAPIIAPDRLTIGELLRRQGYSTACIGKWHLGFDWPTKDGQPPRSGPRLPLSNVDFTKPIQNGPTTRGFDRYFGVDIACYAPFCFIENDHTVGIPSVPNTPNINRIGPMLPGWKFEEIMPTITERAVDYITNAAKTEPRKPFFLFFSLTAPHYPVVPRPRFKGKSGAGNYGDFVLEIDWSVGEVLDALQRAGIDDNTLVIFTSDNGPEITGEVRIGAYDRAQKYGHESMGDLRGIKRDTYEGGHRVPFLARWPGKIPADTVNNEPISQVDFFATAAALAGAKIPANAAEDSFNILPALVGQSHPKPIRPPLILTSGSGHFAIRDGKWILIDAPSGDTNALLSGGHGETEWFQRQRGYVGNDQPGELYDLEKDPAQRHNLFGEQLEKVRELRAFLEKAITDGRTTPGPKVENDVVVHRVGYETGGTD